MFPKSRQEWLIQWRYTTEGAGAPGVDPAIRHCPPVSPQKSPRLGLERLNEVREAGIACKGTETRASAAAPTKLLPALKHSCWFSSSPNTLLARSLGATVATTVGSYKCCSHFTHLVHCGGREHGRPNNMQVLCFCDAIECLWDVPKPQKYVGSFHSEINLNISLQSMKVR